MRLTIDVFYDKFVPSQHPRGQPENKGEFATTGNTAPAAKTAKSPTKTAELKGQNVSLTPVKEQAYTGKQVETKTKLSKQEAGALGERIILAHLQQKYKDAHPLNGEAGNYPVDMVAGKNLIEAKTGLVSNSPPAQKWRATIGQPGKAETEWLKTASPQAKTEWNEKKMSAIMARKAAALAEQSKKFGIKLNPVTVAAILNPDTQMADVYEIPGYHHHIRWNHESTKQARVASYHYT